MIKLARYLRHYRKECILAPLFKLLEAIFCLLVPLVMAQVVDVGVANADKPYILSCGALLLGMGLLGMLSSFTAQYFCAKLSAGFGTELRDDLFHHVLGLSRKEIDSLGQATLVTRITNDSQQIQDGVNQFFRLVLRSPFIVIGALVLVWAIDGMEGLIYTASVTLLFIIVFAVLHISSRLYREVQRHLDDVLLRTSENLEGVRVIRAFRREHDEIVEMNKTAGVLRGEQTHVGNISGLMNPMTYVVINIGLLIVLYVGGYQVYVGGLKQGLLVAFVNYSAQILVEGIKLANIIIQESKAMACATRVNEIFATTSSMTEGSLDATREQPSVEFNDVTFVYPGAAAPALSHVSFKASPGETIGIIGGTGSGKTTLASLLMRFYDASEGNVSVGGHDVRNYSIESLRREVSIVEQGARLFSGTIGSNLRWGNAKATDDELARAISIAQASDVVSGKGGLDSVVEQFGRNFSGGQRQRLTIARTLVRKPGVLILDDSSSALDFATDAALRHALHTQLRGTTCVLISQRVTAINSADKICVLDHGHLVGLGTHDELLASCTVYQEIYASQVKGGDSRG